MASEVLLIADDNEDNRLVFATVLRHYGYNVLEAADGESAIELAAAHGPNLILLDLRMPGMTGWETVRHLKTADTTRKIPVLAVSAERPDTASLRQFGFCGFVIKPITPKALIAAIEHCFENLAEDTEWIDVPADPTLPPM